MLVSSGLSWCFSIVLFGIKTNSFIVLALIFLPMHFPFWLIPSSPIWQNRARRRAVSWTVMQLLAWCSASCFPIAILLRDGNRDPIQSAYVECQAIEIALWKKFTFTDMLMPIASRFLRV